MARSNHERTVCTGDRSTSSPPVFETGRMPFLRGILLPRDYKQSCFHPKQSLGLA